MIRRQRRRVRKPGQRYDDEAAPIESIGALKKRVGKARADARKFAWLRQQRPAKTKEEIRILWLKKRHALFKLKRQTGVDWKE